MGFSGVRRSWRLQPEARSVLTAAPAPVVVMRAPYRAMPIIMFATMLPLP